MDEKIDPEVCAQCDSTGERLKEIHEAIVGTTEKSGLVGRTEKLEKAVGINTRIIGLAVLAVAGFAFDQITT